MKKIALSCLIALICYAVMYMSYVTADYFYMNDNRWKEKFNRMENNCKNIFVLLDDTEKSKYKMMITDMHLGREKIAYSYMEDQTPDIAYYKEVFLKNDFKIKDDGIKTNFLHVYNDLNDVKLQKYKHIYGHDLFILIISKNDKFNVLFPMYGVDPVDKWRDVSIMFLGLFLTPVLLWSGFILFILNLNRR